MVRETQQKNIQKQECHSFDGFDGKFHFSFSLAASLRPGQSSTPSFPARVWTSLSMCPGVGALVIIETYRLSFGASEHWATATPVKKEK